MSVSHDHGYLASGQPQGGGRPVGVPQQAIAMSQGRQMVMTNRPVQYVNGQMGSFAAAAPGIAVYATSAASTTSFVPNLHGFAQQQPQQQPIASHSTTITSMYQQQVQHHPQMIQQQVYQNGNQGMYHQQYHTSSNLSLNVPMREPTPPPIVEVKPEVEAPPPSTSQEDEEEEDADAEIDIQIRNVVCNYTLPLHIDLRRVALNCNNVTFDRGRGVLMKQKRNPNCYIKIYSSGKIYIVGCRSEVDCMTAARTIARSVQKIMGKEAQEVKIRNYKVCNVLATCKMPFGIKIEELAQKYPAQSQYEPELSVGLVWRSQDPKATLRIHTTGSITVTGATSENSVMRSIEIIYPIVREFRCAQRQKGEKPKLTRKRPMPHRGGSRGPFPKQRASGAMGNRVYFSDEEDEDVYDDLDDDEI